MAKTLVYQMYPISWEKLGGLKAMKQHLSRVADLGVDYVWISPLYPSLRVNHVYGILSYMAIDSRFGTMRDFDEFVSCAHSYGIGVLMDLTLDHTSTHHYWFSEHPEYYYWDETERDGWQNLFDGQTAWTYDKYKNKYYLHSFHPQQADLNWFPFGDQFLISHRLVYEFQKIVDFWTKKHSVDGFRIDTPQSINKDIDSPRLEIALKGERAVEVLNAIFGGGRENLFLMMGCLDPTCGEITEYYTSKTPIDFVANTLLKDKFDGKASEFAGLIRQSAKNPKFMLDLESHDSPRFLCRDISFYRELQLMFGNEVQSICLYQGQELGIKNPPREMADWDYLYKMQMNDPDSNLNTLKKFLKRWRV